MLLKLLMDLILDKHSLVGIDQETKKISPPRFKFPAGKAFLDVLKQYFIKINQQYYDCPDSEVKAMILKELLLLSLLNILFGNVLLDFNKLIELFMKKRPFKDGERFPVLVY